MCGTADELVRNAKSIRLRRWTVSGKGLREGGGGPRPTFGKHLLEYSPRLAGEALDSLVKWTPHFRPVDAIGGMRKSYAHGPMGVVSSEIEQVIEFFRTRREAERMLAEVVRDEPNWQELFYIECIELGSESLN